MAIRFHKFAAAVLWTAMVLAAQAGRPPTAIEPVEEVFLATATPEDAQLVICRGAVKCKWTPQVVSPELVRCRYPKWSLVVDVPHTASAFSIRHSGSAGLNYNPAAGTIHPSYNKVVRKLAETIQGVPPPAAKPVPAPVPQTRTAAPPPPDPGRHDKGLGDGRGVCAVPKETW